ncbi:chromatin remodeling complex subunit [Medicago truncatula]|uniref:Chromatin remodeling complex subunit n=1 Tax=Medicago truncatula TaxID=3880 RepID=A0A072VMM3_MEDTR|nr:chromatin remodeling complex subunit [Medicago truncatula]
MTHDTYILILCLLDQMPDKSQGNDVESEKNGRVHNESRGLHVSLKPQMTKLCEVLLLPDNVKTMVDNFLEYVMNNHHFNMESVSILQAFQISLIWTAASLLRHKVEHKASLTLAKQYLNFDCNQTDVDHRYSLLRCLKKIFVYRTGTYNDTSSPKASKSLNGISCLEVAREVELFNIDLSKSIRKIQKK